MNILTHTYRINEIFYSLQGEGMNAGVAAIFIRFSGCNLRCPFCDTDFHTYKEMTADEIAEKVNNLHPRALIVLTGGEPSLQVDYNLISRLRSTHRIAIETNGTNDFDTQYIDCVTLSPKTQWQQKEIKLKMCDEVKVVMDENTKDEDLWQYETIFPKAAYFVQPCDTGDKERNKKIIQRCVDFCKAHHLWRLSLQQQKILNIR